MVDRRSVIAAGCCEGIVTSIPCGGGKRTPRAFACRRAREAASRGARHRAEAAYGAHVKDIMIWLAAVLIVHALIALFIVGGLAAIWVEVWPGFAKNPPHLGASR